MSEHLLVGLASIIVLGIAAQWLAWRLHLPAILLLLIFGFLTGPVTGILKPDEVFGDLLFPLVSISVAIILFEGGLSLRLDELRRVGHIVRNLTTVGVLITWLLTAAATWLIAGVELWPAVLLGAILVVSGPTVIIPLLRQVRPVGKIGSIVRWEGIVNDPIGAILAVLVFEVLVSGGAGEGSSLIVLGAAKAVISGGVIGLAGAATIVLLLKRYLIPDFLQNPVALMVVVISYVAANALQMESGLLAVTVMGFALANQRFISIKQISEFKETLRVLLISSLFIILAARLPVGQMVWFNGAGWILVGTLIVVVRPAMVFVSTMRSDLRWRERLFLAWMAPRGIVAAAVVSVFAIRLADAGFEGYSGLVPLTFQVIIGTVAVYGLTAVYVARRLQIAQPNPQGVLFAGAHSWAREMAVILRTEGFEVVLIDSNWENVTQARHAGCRAYYANILSEDLLHELQLNGIGRLLALTSNDEVNSLAALRFVDVFGRSEVYQLPQSNNRDQGRPDAMPLHLRGRYLFDQNATYESLSSLFRSGAVVKKTPLTEAFDFAAYRAMYGAEALPVFVITESGNLSICLADSAISPKPGQTLVSVVNPTESTSQPQGDSASD